MTTPTGYQHALASQVRWMSFCRKKPGLMSWKTGKGVICLLDSSKADLQIQGMVLA